MRWWGFLLSFMPVFTNVSFVAVSSQLTCALDLTDVKYTVWAALCG